MKYHVSSFEVILYDYRDRHFSFEIVANYISDSPIDGCYDRARFTIFSCENWSRRDKEYARIMNLCTASRYFKTEVNTSFLDYRFGFDANEPLFSLHYGFCFAEEIRALCRALDVYGIYYEFDDSDLPF